MKKGLNVMDIAKYHKWLNAGIPLKNIARRLHTSVAVLERLTPKAWAAGEKKRKAIEERARKQRIENKKKADILVETAAKVMSDSSPSLEL